SQVIPASDLQQLFVLCGALGAVLLVTLVFNLVRGLATLRLRTVMNNGIQAALWDRLLRLPLAFFNRFAAGDLATRAHSINQIREILAGATVSAVMGSLFSLFSLAYLFSISASLALICLGFVLVVALLSLAFIL